MHRTSVNPVTTHIDEPDRVRAGTAASVNARLDRLTQERLLQAVSENDYSRRLGQLGREWDFDRIVEAEAAATGLLGLALAAAVNRRFLLLPGVATAMMLVHAIHGWYPLLPLLRRMGVRSRDEIERERYAVKALRGDFAAVKDASAERRAEAAWRAVHT
jgi:hypothetical protein